MTHDTSAGYAMRPYADETDYARMRQLLVAIVASGDPRHYCTVGDLDWWRFTASDPEAVRGAQLWFAGDDLIAFAWPGVDIMAHPAHRAVEDAMLAWAEGQGAAEAASPRTCTAWAHDGDAARVALLGRRGYARTERCYRYRSRLLGDALPEPPLPPGYAVRNVRGEAGLERRVAAHRAAFAPSRMTVAKHRAVMAAPTYRADLDLVTVAPDGSFASYCIAWFDAANRIGVFEPVGTDPAHQRRGLGKVVLAEGLRRLRALGAQLAFVNTNGDNVAANPLYESVGFRVVDENHAWVKEL